MWLVSYPTGSSRARVHRAQRHARCSSTLVPSLMPMSGFQPSPSHATPAIHSGKHSIVKPRPWPPSGTHPPPDGVVPFKPIVLSPIATSLQGGRPERPGLLFLKLLADDRPLPWAEESPEGSSYVAVLHWSLVLERVPSQAISNIQIANRSLNHIWVVVLRQTQNPAPGPVGLFLRKQPLSADFGFR